MFARVAHKALRRETEHPTHYRLRVVCVRQFVWIKDGQRIPVEVQKVQAVVRVDPPRRLLKPKFMRDGRLAQDELRSPARRRRKKHAARQVNASAWMLHKLHLHRERVQAHDVLRRENHAPGGVLPDVLL